MGQTPRKLFKVFVYGTLKKGEPNHHWLSNPGNGFSRCLGAAVTKDKFPLVVATRYNIPFLLDKCGVGHNVRGEVYEVDEDMFAKLDELEGYPGYYDRREMEVTAEKNTQNCWVYFMRDFPEKLLEKPFLENYTNTQEQPYCERSRRVSHINAKDDMAFEGHWRPAED